ncbi:MAG: hypothetical protein IPJ03_19820 [Ignavibacteriales bacterium]|nr:hypothetical protein [Ignavibacteriales bacterium]
MNRNKNLLYDGWFYDAFILPNQDRLIRQINYESILLTLHHTCNKNKF